MWFPFQHVVDAVLAIRRPSEPIDLHMVEIMEMQHKTDMDTTYVIFCMIVNMYKSVEKNVA